jgi:hypothetical protein
MTAPAVASEIEQRADRKLAAQVAAAEARLADAELKIPELEAAYVKAQADEDAAWPGDDTSVDSEAYGAWAQLANASSDIGQRLMRAYDIQRKAQAELATLAAPEVRQGMLAKMAQDEQRFRDLRERHGAERTSTPRAVEPDPPGTEELRAVVDANKEAWKAYNAATAAGDEATRTALRPQYQEYRRAYRALLAARKAAAPAAAAGVVA